jgi:hypothetical protein
LASTNLGRYGDDCIIEDYESRFPLTGDMQTHCSNFTNVVASMAGEVSVVSLMMFLFRLLTVHGFF